MESKSETRPTGNFDDGNLPTLSQIPSFISLQPQQGSLFPSKKKRTQINTSIFFQKRPAISSLSFVQLPCHTNIVDPGVLHRAFFSLPLRPIRRSHPHCPLGPVRSWNRWQACCKPEKKSGSPLLMELMDTLSIIFSHDLQGFYTSQVIKPDFYHQQYEYYNVK